MIVLFFGQPASGKTTLAKSYINNRVFKHNENRSTYIHIDGDNWRLITNNVNYSKEGRMQNLKSAFNMALFLEKEGFIPILSFVTPYKELRNYLAGKANKLVQIYLFYDQERGRTNLFAKDFEVPDGEFASNELLEINTSYISIVDPVTMLEKYISEKK